MLSKKKIGILTFILVLSLLITSPVLAAGQARFFTINQISGTVYVVQKEGGPKVPAVNGMKVGPKAEIITGGNATVKVTTDDGGSVTLAPNTRLTVKELSTNKNNAKTTILKTWTGKVFMRTQKLIQKDSRFQVETPNAVAGVRGTIWEVTGPTGGSTSQVRVYEGAVAVNGGSVITSMQQATSIGLNSLPEIKSFQAEALDAWTGRQLAGAIQDSVAAITQRIRQGNVSPAEQQQMQQQLSQLTALRSVVEEVYKNNGLPAPPPLVIPPDVSQTIGGGTGNGSGQGGQGNSGQSFGDATAANLPTNNSSGGGSGNGGGTLGNTPPQDDRNQQQIKDQIEQQTSNQIWSGLAAGLNFDNSSSTVKSISTLDPNNVYVKFNSQNSSVTSSLKLYDSNQQLYDLTPDSSYSSSFNSPQNFSFNKSGQVIGTDPDLNGMFQYTSVGKFNYAGNSGNSLGNFVIGKVTIDTDLPLTATATYNGAVVGNTYISGDDNASSIKGLITLNADFGNRSITGAFSNMLYDGILYQSWLNPTVNASWQSGSSQYSGTLDAGNGTTGDISGLFYGSAAQETGGNWRLAGTGMLANGVFAAGTNLTQDQIKQTIGIPDFNNYTTWSGLATGLGKDSSNTVKSVSTNNPNDVYIKSDSQNPSSYPIVASLKVYDDANQQLYDLTPAGGYSNPISIFYSPQNFSFYQPGETAATEASLNGMFQYTSVGHFSYAGINGNSLGNFVIGKVTAGTDLPLNASATYNGAVEGNFSVDNGNVNTVKGLVNLNANFGSKTISGDFSNMFYNLNGQNYSWYNPTISAGWQTGSSQYSGTLDAGNGVTGSINGLFYGSAAQETGGNWKLSGAGMLANGVFAAGTNLSQEQIKQTIGLPSSNYQIWSGLAAGLTMDSNNAVKSISTDNPDNVYVKVDNQNPYLYPVLTSLKVSDGQQLYDLTPDSSYSSSFNSPQDFSFDKSGQGIGTDPDLNGMFQYTSIGKFYLEDSSSNENKSGNFVIGMVTPSTSLPLNATATYHGAVMGNAYYSGDTNLSTVKGLINLTANFGNRTVNGAFSDMVYLRDDQYHFWYTPTISGSWQSGSNQYSGTLDAGNGVTGSLSGLFYGSGAGETGGNWNLSSGTDMLANGVFAAGTTINPEDVKGNIGLPSYQTWTGFASGFANDYNSNTSTTIFNTNPEDVQIKAMDGTPPDFPLFFSLKVHDETNNNYGIAAESSSSYFQSLGNFDFYGPSDSGFGMSTENYYNQQGEELFHYTSIGLFNYSQDGGNQGGRFVIGAATPISNLPLTASATYNGAATPISNLPLTASATYNGAVLGSTYTPGDEYSSSVKGLINLTANFGNRTINGAFSDMIKDDSSLWYNPTISGGWNTGSNTYTANLSTTEGLSGTLNGLFYGPGAVETGGNWKLSGTDTSSGNNVFANGVFAAGTNIERDQIGSPYYDTWTGFGAGFSGDHSKTIFNTNSADVSVKAMRQDFPITISMKLHDDDNTPYGDISQNADMVECFNSFRDFNLGSNAAGFGMNTNSEYNSQWQDIFQYNTIGSFSYSDASGNFVIGAATPISNLPITASATYNGVVVGSTYSSGDSIPSTVKGLVTLNADFGSKTINGAFSNMVKTDSDGYLSSWYNPIISGGWQTGSNQYSGTLDAGNGITGNINGLFYGSEAQETGGNWKLSGTDMLANGVFAAGRYVTPDNIKSTFGIPDSYQMEGLAVGVSTATNLGSGTVTNLALNNDGKIGFDVLVDNGYLDHSIKSVDFNVKDKDDNSYNVYYPYNSTVTFADTENFTYSYYNDGSPEDTSITTSGEINAKYFHYLTLGDFSYNGHYYDPDDNWVSNEITGGWVAGITPLSVYSPPATEPNVTATYYGIASANGYNTQNDTVTSSGGFTGKVRLDVNFSQRNIGGNIDFTGTALGMDKITLNGGWTAGGNNIQFTSVNGYTNATDTTPSMTGGTGQALFYGPNSEEIGGKWYIDNSSTGGSNFINGIFAAGETTKWTGLAAGFSFGSSPLVSLYDEANGKFEYDFVPSQPNYGIVDLNFKVGDTDLAPTGLNLNYNSSQSFVYENQEGRNLHTLDNSQFSYLALGEWNYPTLSAGNQTQGCWVAGQLTNNVDIPTSGSASYSGTVRGYLNGDQLLYGGLSLAANFASRTLTGSAGLFGDAPFNQLNFNGNWASGVNLITGSVGTNNLSFNGTMKGFFFGPGAQEVGGQWQVTNGTDIANGVFGAKQGDYTQPTP